jgi:filamentous hemagglutinin family protein
MRGHAVIGRPLPPDRNKGRIGFAIRPAVSAPARPAARQRLLGSTAFVLCASLPLFGAPAGNALSLTQTSARATINWGSFSIGRVNSVTFNQPGASSAILNRVTGSTSSTIAGRLNANGQVFLVNPNGIAITRSGAVKVGGGFVASTLAISNDDFNAGNLNFTGVGASASVTNAGSVIAAPGGFVGLIGGSASNSGTISVPLGKVALGSGERATLDPTGDGFLQVAMPTNATAVDGRALVDVSGKINAAGGRVQLKAATVAGAIRDAVNVSGFVSASSAHSSGGSIVLGGGPGGNVRVTGKLAASGKTGGGAVTIAGRNASLSKARIAAVGKAGPGGSVTVTAGNAVSLASTMIDASGASGGGAVKSGLWLVDPTNLTIDAASASTISSNLVNSDVLLQTNDDGTTSGIGIASPGAGDIIVDSGVSWASNHTLTLTAFKAIAVNAPLTISGVGALVLNAAMDTTTASGASLLKLSFGSAGSVSYTGAEGSGQSLTINGTPYALSIQWPSSMRSTGSARSTARR